MLETSYDDLEVQGHPGRMPDRQLATRDVRAVAVAGDLEVETSYARVRVEDAARQGRRRRLDTSTSTSRRVAGPCPVDTSYEKVFLVRRRAGHGHRPQHGRRRPRTSGATWRSRTSYEPVQVNRCPGPAHRSTPTTPPSRRRASPGATISVADVLRERRRWPTSRRRSRSSNRNGSVTLEPRDLKHGLDVRNEYGDDRARLAGRARRPGSRPGRRAGRCPWGLAGQARRRRDQRRLADQGLHGRDRRPPRSTCPTSYDDIRIEEGRKAFLVPGIRNPSLGRFPRDRPFFSRAWSCTRGCAGR
ncbi:MAG: hypothetical protein M0C28_33045 [Candidatus Moduliflexus flocculans]|nr:hypothetical protein [Candidatus Moduliflexus flocculans]